MRRATALAVLVRSLSCLTPAILSQFTIAVYLAAENRKKH